MASHAQVNLAVLCPGQGAQHVHMLDLIAGNPAAEAVLDAGALALGSHAREWLSKPDSIHDNNIAQPLVCLTELATWAALQETIDRPIAFAGYSVGELAAYACAGALDAGELARLAHLRASVMDAAPVRSGSLIALRGLGRAAVEGLCAGQAAWVAIVNGDDAFVIGGETEALERLGERAVGQGAMLTCLKVSVASHTPLLASAVEPFRSAVQASALRAPDVPVVAGVDASFVITRQRAIATLAAQLARTIEWPRCLEALYERGCRVFFELGPGSALSRMARPLLPGDIEVRALADFRTLDGAVKWLQRRARY
jgi:[acyl-carrier-protein] S-malonyltransferase